MAGRRRTVDFLGNFDNGEYEVAHAIVRALRGTAEHLWQFGPDRSHQDILFSLTFQEPPEVAILVVSAICGATADAAEQIRLARLVGVERFVIAIPDTDRVEDPLWRDLVEADCRRLFAEVGVPADELSVVAGDFAADPRCGGALVAALVAFPLPKRADIGPTRFVVEAVDVPGGEMTSVLGRVLRGVIRAGDELEPVNTVPSPPVTVRSVWSHGIIAASVTPGDPAGLVLQLPEPVAIGVGTLLTAPGTTYAHRFLETVLYLPHDTPPGIETPLVPPNRLRMRVFDAEFSVQLRHLLRLDGFDVAETHPGMCVRAMCWPDVRLSLEPGDRFILRDWGSRPRAVGVVMPLSEE